MSPPEASALTQWWVTVIEDQVSQVRILVIEDDRGIAEGLALLLRHAGYATDVCATLACAGAALAAERFDLVLLDLGLPDGDGLDWLQRFRRADTGLPVLVMTARDALADRVSGLDSGADDYLVKPVEPEELLARIRLALRRSEGRARPVIQHGEIEVDPAARTVTRAGQPVTLRAKEFSLLLALLRGSGQVLSRQRLEEALYGFDTPLESNAVEVHIHHLRRKLGDSLIRTVRGVGYFVPRADRGSPGEP